MKIPIDTLERFKTKAELKSFLKDSGCKADSKALQQAIPKEKDFQSRILKELELAKTSGAIPISSMFWKQGATPYGNTNGLPDIIALIDGTMFGFEVKRPFLGEPTKLQEERIEEINECGGHAATVSYFSEVKEVLRKAGKYKDDIQRTDVL